MKKRLWRLFSHPYSLYIVPVTLYVLVKFPAMFEGFWYEDEGIYAAIGQGMIQGKALYSEIWDHKPPFLYVLYSILGRFGWGTGFTIVKVLALLCGAITLVFILKSLKLLAIRYRYQIIAGGIAAILLGSPIVEGDVANAEIFFLPITAYFLYLLLHDSLNADLVFGKFNGIILGFLAFIVFTIKIPGFFEAGFVLLCYLIMVFVRKRDLFSRLLLGVIAGFGIPFIVLILYFVSQGTLGNFVDAVLIANLSYTSTEFNVVHIGPLSLSLNIVKAFLLLLTVGGSLILYRKQKLTTPTLVIILVFASELFASLLSGKPYPHYLQQLIPGLTLLLAILLPRIIRAHIFFKLALVTSVILISIPIVSFFVGEHAEIVKHTFKDFYPGFVNQILLHRSNDQFSWSENPITRRNHEFARYFSSTYPESTYFLYSNQPWIIAQIPNYSTNKYTVAYQYGYLPRYLEEDRNNRDKAEYFILDTSAWRHEAFFEGMDRFEKVEDHNGFEIYKNNIDN